MERCFPFLSYSLAVTPSQRHRTGLGAERRTRGEEEKESGGAVRRGRPARLSACLFACVSSFNEEKGTTPLKGNLSVQVHTLHIP